MVHYNLFNLSSSADLIQVEVVEVLGGPAPGQLVDQVEVVEEQVVSW
jgi:hypothetical protein